MIITLIISYPLAKQIKHLQNMIKVILKITESEINNTLSKLAKLGITDIKIKKEDKHLTLFRYKNIIQNTDKNILTSDKKK